MAALER